MSYYKTKRRRIIRRGRSSEDGCCDELQLRHQYVRYHRFFIFSPMFIVMVLAIGFFTSRGQLPRESYAFLLGIVIVVTTKEVVGLLISRRIYNHILRPVEDLKYGLFEVSRGNYDLTLSSSTNPEIAELIGAFNQMSERLKTSELEKIKYEENRKALIASISHDLKTPITAINGFVEGILDGVADTQEKQEAYLTIVSQNGKYMNRLIDDLLLYAKLDLHKLKFDCTPIDYGQYVSELFLELSLENEELGIQISLDHQLKQPLILHLDAKHMTRAIRNITANAVSYGQGEEPAILFSLNKDDERAVAVLTIKDNGPGIEEKHLESLFDRFYRADEARTTPAGSSGLGLAIAKEIVEAHSGHIWIESEVGKGTTIGIELPLDQEGEACQKQKY